MNRHRFWSGLHQIIRPPDPADLVVSYNNILKSHEIELPYDRYDGWDGTDGQEITYLGVNIFVTVQKSLAILIYTSHEVLL